MKAAEIRQTFLKFFESKSESAAGFGFVGDVLGVELLGTPLDASLPGAWTLPQPAPITQMQDRLASKVRGGSLTSTRSR